VAESPQRAGKAADPVPSPAQVADEFFSLYHVLKYYVDRQVDNAMGDAGIPMACSKLLGILNEHGPRRFTELAALTGTGARSLTQTVDTLERSGLAKRQPDPTDRRAILVNITDLGTTTYLSSVGPRLEAFEHLFGALSDDERASFLKALRLLRERA
jgi:DNA-binding MarR family transcriptional regulator